MHNFKNLSQNTARRINLPFDKPRVNLAYHFPLSYLSIEVWSGLTNASNNKMYLIQKITSFSPHRMTLVIINRDISTGDISKLVWKKSLERQHQPRDRRALEPSFFNQIIKNISEESHIWSIDVRKGSLPPPLANPVRGSRAPITKKFFKINSMTK